VPTITATGLSASDASGFAAGGTMQLALLGPNGAMGPQASVTLTAGMTIGDIVTALNSAFGSAANFTLSSNGQLTMTPGAGYSGYSLNVLSDSTQRGTTGLSVSSLFGLGSEETVDQAESFSVNPSVASGKNALSFATPQITPTTVAGGTVVASGDSSGLLALQNLSNTQISFPSAGILNGQTNTLGNYAGSFYQSIATITQSTQSNATSSSDQLTEAQSRQSQESGVNLDAELSNMVLYQQAYSAGARVMQSVEQVFATLMQIQ
jgi:flagellar hook-associated protein 1 FlgK